MFALSIIIPVYNKWELTRQCLASLAATCAGADDLEVLVVDNASSDATASRCGPTGRALFGERFQHLRQNSNRHFAGACNLGGQAASGRDLLFLNNDTICLPDWRTPLWRALHEGLPGFDCPPAAVGPLLLYPEADGFRDRVQHLGITFSPTMQVAHLYEHFPAAHPLVHKVRKLQAITAAALYMDRNLFWQLGGFDEAFINGFEDVDFCARLSVAGHWMACVPEACIQHLCGQTPGRGDHDVANSQLLTAKCHDLLLPDKHSLLAADGYRLTLSPWGSLETALSPERETALRKRYLADRSPATALALVTEEPFWIEGYILLARQLTEAGQTEAALNVLVLATRFDGTPATRLPLWNMARQHGLLPQFANLETSLRRHLLPTETRTRMLLDLRRRFRHIFPALAEDANRHLASEARFVQHEVDPLKIALGFNTSEQPS